MCDVSWRFLNHIIRKQSKTKDVTVNDFNQKGVDLETKRMGALFAERYNRNPHAPIFTHLVSAHKKNFISICIGIPLNGICIACNPACVYFF